MQPASTIVAVFVMTTLCLFTLTMGTGSTDEAGVPEITRGAQGAPLDLWGTPLGTAQSLRFDLPADISTYTEALVLLHVDDIDAPQEVALFLNDSGPLAWPASSIGEGEHGGAIRLKISDLRPGANYFKFVFKDNLNNTTAGFGILEAELQLFTTCTPDHLARITREAASWGTPVNWCRAEARAVPSNWAEPSLPAPVIADFFQDSPLERWTASRGAWQADSGDIDIYKTETSDIYISPEEPSHLAWVGLWREEDGAIKTSFAQLTGNSGLEPSYRSTYGRGKSEEAWLAFTTKHRLRLGPEDAATTTKLQHPTLATRDNGDTWEYLGLDHEPRGGNLRFALAEDGSLVRKGLDTIRCRDGRLVSTVGATEWQQREASVIGVRESLDNGKTWSTAQYITPEGADPEIMKGISEETAIVELDDGRILAIIRTDPGRPCQTYLTRVGPGQYTATPPTWTPMPHSGLPELERGPDGVVWCWGHDGHWYSADDGQTWRPTAARLPCYYGKMLATGPGQLLCVSQHLIHDSPYPYYHDATIRQYRFSYRRSGVMRQTDADAPLALLTRADSDCTDLHLRAEVRVDGVNGLAFRVQPDGQSYYIFMVILPDSEVYQEWFPPEVETEKLSAIRGEERLGGSDHWNIAQGYPMLVLARVDNNHPVVLAGWRFMSSVSQGDWLQLQVEVSGDLIQAAARKDGPATYVGTRDPTYASGAIGLFTDQSPGGFRNIAIWDSPQMMRHLWRD